MALRTLIHRLDAIGRLKRERGRSVHSPRYQPGDIARLSDHLLKDIGYGRDGDDSGGSTDR